MPASRFHAPAACKRRCNFGLRREDFHAVIDGMEMDVVGDIRAPDDAALEHIAIGSRARSGGCRCACSEWKSATASRWRTIWGARCSSPISCATSTRTRRSGACICPRKRCAKPASRRRIRRRCWRTRARQSLRPRRGTRARAFHRGRRDHGAQPAPDRARSAHHGGGLPADPRQPCRPRLVASAPSDPSAEVGCCGSSCGTPSSDAAHSPCRRRGTCRARRRGAPRRTRNA